VDKVNNQGGTPLQIMHLEWQSCCCTRHAVVMTGACHNCADVNGLDRLMCTPLHYACERSHLHPHLHVVKLLLVEGAEVDKARPVWVHTLRATLVKLLLKCRPTEGRQRSYS